MPVYCRAGIRCDAGGDLVSGRAPQLRRAPDRHQPPAPTRLPLAAYSQTRDRVEVTYAELRDNSARICTRSFASRFESGSSIRKLRLADDRPPSRRAAAGRRRARSGGGRGAPRDGAAGHAVQPVVALRLTRLPKREADVRRRPSCADRARSSGTPSRCRACRAARRSRPCRRCGSRRRHLLEAGHHAQRCRLAAARGADEDQELAFADLRFKSSTATVRRRIAW